MPDSAVAWEEPDDSLVEALRGLLGARFGREVRRIDTHISWVLLDGEHAWKLKKPLRLGFLDFSRIEVRRHCCEEELRLNRRLAPSVYLDVLPVHGTVDEPRLGIDREERPGPAGDRDGAAIEYVLRMRQFAPGSLFSERLAAGRLDPGTVDRLALRLADFHEAAPVAGRDTDFGDAARVRRTTADVLDRIESRSGALRIAALRRWWETRVDELATVFDARKAAGRVRECHGDLHLANLVVLDDDVTAFDCIEFDPALRWIDVACDIGFVTMDFQAHGRRDLAFRFLDRWLEATGDHDGLAVLRYYEVHRALVRGLVTLIHAAQGEPDDGRGAPDYLRVARDLAQAGDPRLLITHGLSGSGKSRTSAPLVERIGAIRVRSDVERKRLFGLGALDRTATVGPAEAYGPEATRRTYERLRHVASVALRAGYPVVVDAAFLRRAEREAFRALARELGVPFTILDCRAHPDVLRERVRARAERGDDPSEADVAVLERQLASQETLGDDELPAAIPIDTALPTDLDALARRWLAASPGTARR